MQVPVLVLEQKVWDVADAGAGVCGTISDATRAR